MTFPASGSMYTIELNPPVQATSGLMFINFYASFYHRGLPSSVLECGLSLSERKHWNFFANQGGKPTDHPVSAPTTHAPLALVIQFHADGPRRGLIDCALGSTPMSVVQHDRFRSIDTMRLVVAAGNREGASFSEVGMRLAAVDCKPPPHAGLLEFMAGERVTVANHRIQLINHGHSGFTCALPGK